MQYRERGGLYYLISCPREEEETQDGSSDNNSPTNNLMASGALNNMDDQLMIPYWAIFTFEQNKLHCRAQISFFHSTTKNCNNRKVINELSERIGKILRKVNCALLVDQLRSTLYCSDQLQIGDTVVFLVNQGKIEKTISIPSLTRGSSRTNPKKVTSKFENFSRRPAARNPAITSFPIAKEEDEEEDKPGTNANQKEPAECEYKVPMIHQEYFPMPERFKTEHNRKKEGITLLKDSPFLRNFKIANRENSYLAFSDKEIYILVFEEIENPFITKTDRSSSIIDQTDILRRFSYERKGSMTSQNSYLPTKRSFKMLEKNKEFDSDSSFPETRTVLLLKIHSIEEVNEKAIDHIISQVSEQLTIESIKILAPTFIKYTQLKLSKIDYDFFTIGVPIKVKRHLLLLSDL